MSEAPDLKPLIISAPFGNYIQPDGATATLGTFTAQARHGRLWRILRTVRYYRRIRAWVNRLGLRNPGLEWLDDRINRDRIDPADKIISIHGFNRYEWLLMLESVAAQGPLAIELNMSCPNVGEVGWPDDLFERSAEVGTPVIVKLPPINYELIFERAWEGGLRVFHCCNTLPVPAGGISGQPLKPVSLQCIRSLRQQLSPEQRGELRIIGGGGIRRPADVDAYAEAGASHVAVGTKVMNPLYLLTHRPLRPLIRRARERLEAEPAAV